jgi:hypothetical protein
MDEPHRVCRGLMCLGCAAIPAVRVLAWRSALASVGGTFPVSPGRQRDPCESAFQDGMMFHGLESPPWPQVASDRGIEQAVDRLGAGV